MKPKSAKSNLPFDTTPSLGSNYGLDGFDFDLEYGEGVKDKASLPSARGLSGLPDGVVMGKPNIEKFPVGVVRASEGNFDLTAFMSEPQLNDLDWLEFAEQDLERLPENPIHIIPELVDAWGVERRTDGVNKRLPYQTKEAIDQARPKVAKPGKTASEIKDVVRQAMRRSAYGEPLDKILREAALALGPDAEKAKTAMAALRAEHGLVGKVHIRASVFPGCWNGRFAEEIRKYASQAKYVVASPHCAGCVHAQNNHCAIFKKEIVVDVPWEQARTAYAPRLAAAGQKVASDGNAKEALKAALTSTPRKMQSSLGQIFPTIKTATGVTPEEAFAKLASLSAPVQEKIGIADKQAAEERKQVQVQIAKWHRAGLLPSKEEATRLVRSSADPRSILKAGAALILASKATSYSGSGIVVDTGKTASRGLAWRELERAEKAKKAIKARVESDASEALGKMVKAGLLKDEEVRRIVAKQLPPDEQMRLATAVVARRASTVALPQKTKAAADYTGAGERALPARVAVPKPAAFSSQHIAKVVSEAKRLMNAGHAGKMLDGLLKVHFSGGLLKAASVALKEARDAHEGLAGHVYVDASVYASQRGTTGCDAGALLHRTKGTKFLLAMDRCNGCTAHNVEGVCQRYGKQVTASVPVENPKGFQREMIRLANISDSERTAELFVTDGGQVLAEFGGLSNAPLDDIDLDTAPSSKDLGEILFGGLDAGSDE